MDFINYLLDTKNYSALKAVRDYSSEVRSFALSKKQKAALIAGGLTTTAAVTSINPHTSRFVRKVTGNETEFDKAHNLLDEKFKDDPNLDKYHQTLQDMEDSKFVREHKDKSLGMTVRDRWNNLIGRRTKIDDSIDRDKGFLNRTRLKNAINSTDEDDSDDDED